MPPYKVILAPAALADLEAIHAYIAVNAPANADRMVQRIMDQIESLADMPQRFAAIRTRRNLAYELRKVVVRPYKVLYSIDRDAVLVRAIRHGARRPWP